jgi:hypothetical protein
LAGLKLIDSIQLIFEIETKVAPTAMGKNILLTGEGGLGRRNREKLMKMIHEAELEQIIIL